MDCVVEFLREAGLFIVYIAIAVCGVFAGKAYRAHKDRKKAEEAAALAASENAASE